jgi:type VI secretion system secreted protein Hcp
MAVDFFLKIEGIEGESQDEKHKGEIDIESWSWGEAQAASAGRGAGGGGAGKVSMQDFAFVMRANKASPKLMLSCATGDHIKEAKLTCRKAGGEQQEYMTVRLEDVVVSSYTTSGSAGDGVPFDQFAMNFAKIEFEYKPQKPDGSLDSPVKTGYDLLKNKKV